MIRKLLLGLVLLISFNGYSQQVKIILNDDLELLPLSEGVYMHISYSTYESFGRVASNGLIYINNKEAIVADTPATIETSKVLLNWLASKGIEVKAVVVNHFHSDALAGLSEFHQRGIPSYGYTRTAELAQKDGTVPPIHTFDIVQKLKIGKQKIEARYFGEGHSPDNIALWIPKEKILFGGCMIKSMNSGKGNLGDANVDQWSETVAKVKNYYPDVRMVVPGHGQPGGPELLDFTIQMFETKAKGG